MSRGERASTLAVDGVANYILNTMDWFFRLNDNNEAEFEAELKQAFRHSQSVLEAEAEAIPQRRGMATTLTMAYIDWPKLYVVHVGDTRCYLIRDNDIERLTTDHTIGQLALSAAGESDEDFVVVGDEDTKPFNPMNNALWNVIGGNDTSLDPQVSKSELSVGDALLLCSDGLTRYMSDEELLESVMKDSPASEICEQFIATSNHRGGIDNITAVLAKFNENKLAEVDCAMETVSNGGDDVVAEPIA